jgi:hypothetical protein
VCELCGPDGEWQFPALPPVQSREQAAYLPPRQQVPVAGGSSTSTSSTCPSVVASAVSGGSCSAHADEHPPRCQQQVA